MSSDRSIYNLLPIPLLILCLLYLIIGVLAVKRYWAFTKAKFIGMLGKLYFGFLIIECFTRTVLFILLGLASMGAFEDKSSDSIYYFALNILYIPEFLIWISSTLLFWQYLIMFYIAHINFSLSCNTGDELPVPLRARSFNIMIILIVVFVIIQAVFVILLDTSIVGLNFLLIEDVVINFSLPLIAIVTQFVLHLKFSGAPYVSELYHEKKTRMTRIIIYWILARTLKGVFSIVMISVQGDIANDFTDDTEKDKNDQSVQLLEIVIFFIYYFFAEIVAFSLTINKSIAKIFQFYQYSNPFRENTVLLVQENQNPFEINREKQRISSENNNSIEENNIQNYDQLLQNLDISKLQYDEKTQIVSNNAKFGTIKKAYYYSKPMAIRAIEVQNISNFMAEEVQEDVLRLIKLDWKRVAPIKGIFCDKTRLLLMSDYMEGTFLEVFLASPPDLLINNEDDTRITIALSIAQSLRYLHENELVHGHLSPSNIVLSKKYHAKILDFGFRGLKKLVSLQKGYCNKTKYTAPEHLKEKSLVVKAYNKASDVYSFGVILWELIEKKRAFEGISMKELPLYVVEKQFRPKISEQIDENLSQLVRACWQEDAEKRPNFKIITRIIEQHCSHHN